MVNHSRDTLKIPASYHLLKRSRVRTSIAHVIAVKTSLLIRLFSFLRRLAYILQEAKNWWFVSSCLQRHEQNCQLLE